MTKPRQKNNPPKKGKKQNMRLGKTLTLLGRERELFGKT